MTGLRLFLARLNGWALSLLLHGGVALVAGLSVFSVQMGGGSGRAGSATASGMTTQAFSATLRGEEQQVSGSPIPDLAQYGRLSEETTPEPVTEELPVPELAFDVFSVGSSAPAPEVPQAPADPSNQRPRPSDGRATKLPASSGGGESGESQEGSGDSSGSGGQGATGDGGTAGDGTGKGVGDGAGSATEVYTPAPAYPSEARRRNIEGSVLVDLAIAADGSCSVRQIVESSGFGPLDEAVEKTVGHWKFRSAADDGRTDLLTRRIRFVFKLGK